MADRCTHAMKCIPFWSEATLLRLGRYGRKKAEVVVWAGIPCWHLPLGAHSVMHQGGSHAPRQRMGVCTLCEQPGCGDVLGLERQNCVFFYFLYIFLNPSTPAVLLFCWIYTYVCIFVYIYLFFPLNWHYFYCKLFSGRNKWENVIWAFLLFIVATGLTFKSLGEGKANKLCQ